MSKKLTKKSEDSSFSKVSDTNNAISVDDSDVLDGLETELMRDDMDVDPILENQLMKKETNIDTKTGGYVIENDGVRLDTVYANSDEFESEKKEQEKLLGGAITVSKDNGNLHHYDGVLGSFDYNPNSWAIGTKEVTNPEESVAATIPVLRYIGNAKHGDGIKIPEGVKSLDYTFEGNEEIETVPVIPDSVQSAHCAFMGCTSITSTNVHKDAKDGEKVSDMFDNCESLRESYVSDVFDNCESLRESYASDNFDSNSGKSNEKDSVSEPAKPVNKRRFYDVEETNDMSKDDMDYQMGW